MSRDVGKSQLNKTRVDCCVSLLPVFGRSAKEFSERALAICDYHTTPEMTQGPGGKKTRLGKRLPWV
jgi:hypothetical protein